MRSELVSGISPGFPELSQSSGQVTHVLLTRSPLIPGRSRFTVRLACVKHAASVRPEPGSNSPSMNITTPEGKSHGDEVSEESPGRQSPLPTGVGSASLTYHVFKRHPRGLTPGTPNNGITIHHTLLSSQETDARTTRTGPFPIRSTATRRCQVVLLCCSAFPPPGELITLFRGFLPLIRAIIPISPDSARRS